MAEDTVTQAAKRVASAIDRVCGDDFYCDTDVDEVKTSFDLVYKGEKFRVTVEWAP